jgi:ATP/maltotriose-dependent transcriptional regulator MalT
LRHPDYCRGLTIENDLAVMCHALGDLATAETMARRSLLSWQGVAHTETLSLLVLGSIATSAGRWADAAEALGAAERLAQRQSSSLFLSEVRIRRARLRCALGRHAAALEELALAEELVREDDNPLRFSHLVQVRVMAGLAAGSPPPTRYALALDAVCRRSGHPLVHARAARVEAEVALAAGDAARAEAAAVRGATLAREAGLQELLADALLMRVRARELPGTQPTAETSGWADEAEAIARSIGSLDLAWRASDARHRHGGGAEAARSAAQALADLQQAAPPQEGFDALAAARREPRVLSAPTASTP